MKWKCPHCGNELSEDEATRGSCFSCKKVFENPLKFFDDVFIQREETVKKVEELRKAQNAREKEQREREEKEFAERREAEIKQDYSPKAKKKLLIFLLLVLVIFWGTIRIYYGGEIGMRVVLKASFSFKDTIVNLDDIFGQPRIVVATQHPAVKKQLEEMGIIETDDQGFDRTMEKLQNETERLMRGFRF